MDAANIIGIILEKGLLGALLLLALWDRQKMQNRLFDEHQKRLQDSKDNTTALLQQNEKVHQALTSVANVLETIGTRQAK